MTARLAPVLILVVALGGCGPVLARSRVADAKRALGEVSAAEAAGREVDVYHRVRARAYLAEARKHLTRGDHGWAIRLATGARESAERALAQESGTTGP